MGITSGTTSLTRYTVTGRPAEPVIETLAAGLNKNAIGDIDDNPSEQTAGWTSFRDPFVPDFEGSSFLVGAFIVFALRIDKKSIPAKLVQKHIVVESARRLKEMGRDFLSGTEKKAIKDHVLNRLNMRMPATPNVYDVVWQMEKNELWFFSNLKSANEELESLFVKSFRLNLVRRIPYTMAAMEPTLSSAQQDLLAKLNATERVN